MIELISGSMELSKVTSTAEALAGLDLAICELVPRKRIRKEYFNGKDERVKEIKLFESPNFNQMTVDQIINLPNELFIKEKHYRSFPRENFFVSEDHNVLISKDLRVIIKDYSGRVPPEVLYNAGSTALLMNAGLIHWTVGYDHIYDMMKRYKTPNFYIKYEGYLTIQLGGKLDADHKSRTYMGKIDQGMKRSNP